MFFHLRSAKELSGSIVTISILGNPRTVGHVDTTQDRAALSTGSPRATTKAVPPLVEPRQSPNHRLSLRGRSSRRASTHGARWPITHFLIARHRLSGPPSCTQKFDGHRCFDFQQTNQDVSGFHVAVSKLVGTLPQPASEPTWNRQKAAFLRRSKSAFRFLREFAPQSRQASPAEPWGSTRHVPAACEENNAAGLLRVSLKHNFAC
jgi:hypothetical protein